MKLLGLLLLVTLASSAPTSSEDETIYITEEFFPDSLKKYTSEHDIVNIFVPLNALNVDDDDDSVENDNDGATLFFVQGDFKEDGTFENKGLFVLNTGTGAATKLLDNGVDFTAVSENTKNVYFAAPDGIYIYNAEKNTAEKYGSVTDNIKSIAKAKSADVIYALTADKDLYKVTENGEKHVKVDDVKNAQQIILDDEDNLYFYDDEKHIYVVSKDGIKKFEGLPESPNKITLLRPPFILEKSIPVIVDDVSYLVYANGTVEPTSFELKVHPTAFSLEAALVQYYAYNKSIYEYNILEIILGETIQQLKEYLNDKADNIQQLATRSRSDISQGNNLL